MADQQRTAASSRRVSFDLRAGGRTSRLLEPDSCKSDRFEEETAPELGGFESAENLGEESSEAAAGWESSRSSRRDSSRSSRRDSRRLSVSVAEVAEDLNVKKELVGTVASIILSLVDVALHVAVAAHIQVDYGGGEATPYWWFIALALAANLLAIVFYIYKNVGTAPAPQGGGGAAVWAMARTDLELKLAERPEEPILVMVAGVVSPECLCFLTLEPRQRLRFRRMATLTSLFEGLPIFFCLLLFTHVHGWTPLLAFSFASTVSDPSGRTHAARAPAARHGPRPRTLLHIRAHSNTLSAQQPPPTVRPRSPPRSPSTLRLTRCLRLVAEPDARLQGY